MKRVAVSLVALGVLAVASDRAFAEGALSRPMAAHVAARYGIQHAGLPRHVQRHHARQYYYRQRGRHAYRSYRPHYGHGAVVAYPSVRRYPVVVHPRVYTGDPYYYAPRGGFSYYGRGFSIGIGF